MRIRVPLGLLLVALVGCGGADPGPRGEGDLLVAYSPGNPDAGAMILVINGGPVLNVAAVGGQQVSFTGSQSTARVIVVGTLVSGDLLRIRVPDVSLQKTYSVRAEQVADRNTFALIDPSRHTFTIHR